MPTRDASSPVRVNVVAGTATTASFTPPNGSLFRLNIGFDSNVGAAPTVTPSNTGTGVSAWTLVNSIQNASGGLAAVYEATVGVGSATTVKADFSQANDGAIWVDVWTGAQAGGASSTSTSTTQANNPSVTTTGVGSRVGLVGTDWNNTGTPTSSDTIDAVSIGGGAAFGRAFKGADSGAPGSVSVNFVTGGAGPQNAFVVYEILAGDSTAAGPPMMARRLTLDI